VVATSRRRDARSGAGMEPADARAARAAALDALARRDRSAVDLQRKLVDKGYASQIAADVIHRLCTEKLVDDRRYAENFVSLHASRGHGPLRIRADLRKSGVDDELVDHAVEAYPEWLEQVRKAHQKKFGSRPPADYADRERQARFLRGRGFTGGQVRMALGFDTELDVD